MAEIQVKIPTTVEEMLTLARTCMEESHRLAAYHKVAPDNERLEIQVTRAGLRIQGTLWEIEACRLFRFEKAMEEAKGADREPCQ